MTGLDLALRAMPVLIGTVAVAAIVHVSAILAYPSRAPNDAYTRLARLAPIGVKTDLATADGGPLPFQDPAMATVVCRYDLSNAPFRVSIDGLDQGMLSLGMHSRSGIPFYGINLFGGSGGNALKLILTASQQSEADKPTSDPEPHALRIVAPEREGFVLIEAPTTSASFGRAALARVGCVPGP